MKALCLRFEIARGPKLQKVQTNNKPQFRGARATGRAEADTPIFLLPPVESGKHPPKQSLPHPRWIKAFDEDLPSFCPSDDLCHP